MTEFLIEPIKSSVQSNCHIADARHADEFSLCIYLLKMREYYRWEKQLSFSDVLSKEQVGPWLTEKETLWEQLEAAEYQDVVIGKNKFHQFDTESINKLLVPQGYVYSGGLGYQCRPVFFLARLLKHYQYSHYQVYIADTELARDLAAPPAYTLGNTIFIRRESLKRFIWEKVEEWNWRQQNSALNRAMKHYDYHSNPLHVLEQITDNEIESVLLHEIGELKANDLLDDAWNEMLTIIPRSQAEMMARAIRDHIADGVSTLPVLLEKQREDSIHFYFGNFQSIRQKLFPKLYSAYTQWVTDKQVDKLFATVEKGVSHWSHIADDIVNIYKQYGDQSAHYIEQHVEANIL